MKQNTDSYHILFCIDDIGYEKWLGRLGLNFFLFNLIKENKQTGYSNRFYILESQYCTYFEQPNDLLKDVGGEKKIPYDLLNNIKSEKDNAIVFIPLLIDVVEKKIVDPQEIGNHWILCICVYSKTSNLPTVYIFDPMKKNNNYEDYKDVFFNRLKILLKIPHELNLNLKFLSSSSYPQNDSWTCSYRILCMNDYSEIGLFHFIKYELENISKDIKYKVTFNYPDNLKEDVEKFNQMK